MIQNVEEMILFLRNGNPLVEHQNPNIEVKSSWDKKYGQDLSALGNKVDVPAMFCVIGINDSGVVLGQDENWARNVEKTISQHLNQYLDPIQACKSLTCHDTGRGWVVVLYMLNPGAVVKWESAAYKAAGTTSSKMLPEEVMELTVRLPGLSDKTAQTWTGSIDNSLAKGFLENVSRRFPEFAGDYSSIPEIERNLGRLGISGKYVAHLLFGECKYRVIFYDANETPRVNETRRGLFSLLLADSFMDEIQNWTKTQLSIQENPYSKLALREAIANAIAHGAYMERDGDLILEIFHDRLVISNLSFPVSRYFANRWFSRNHNTVNRLLMETLRLAGFVDELGRGKGVIFSESIKGGKLPPQVFLEGASQYDRWRLVLHGGTKEQKVVRLLQRLRTHYDDQKAQIAAALVLWSNQPVAEIRKYVDGESLPAFIEVLQDLKGPIFYYEKEDRIILRRWAAIMMGEGKDSKTLTIPEEENLLRFARDIHTKYHNGYITPAQLRDLGGMGHTSSEQTLSSTVLSKWLADGEVQRVKKGTYQFVQKEPPRVSLAEIITQRLQKAVDESIP